MNINEVSKEFDLPKATLRYWEKENLIPSVPKNKSGYRDYSEYDLKWILYVNSLRKAGMSIETLKNFISNYGNPDYDDQRKQILIDQKDILEKRKTELQKTINYLDYKIENFDSHMLTYENEKLVYNKKEEPL